MSTGNMLESSSLTVRRCKQLIDAAIHEQLELLDAKSANTFVQLVSVVRANSNVLRPAIVAGPNAFKRIKSTFEVLVKLTEVRRLWQREPWQWTSNEVSFAPSMRSLVEFLLAKSDVPTFLYMGWLRERSDWYFSKKLFLHLAAGNSVRGYQTKSRLTKAMARRFNKTPDHFSLDDAFSFARDPDFKTTEYKFTAGDTKRRRKQFLIAMKLGPASQKRWRRSPVSDFQQTDVEPAKPWSVRVWSIKQLLSESELIAEGDRQNHCVGSYAYKCENGDSTIWSMECRGTMTCHAAVTIEVNSDGRIVTALGKNNRSTKFVELEVIANWAKQEGLEFSAYLWRRLIDLRSLQA